MDAFDTYLYEELTKLYERSILTRDAQEELYFRFGNLDHLEEVQPYRYAMRYLGMGTPAEKDAVLQELQEVSEEEPLLFGLYQDLLIHAGKGNDAVREKLKSAEKNGYSSAYLKEKSALKKAEKPDAKSAGKSESKQEKKTDAELNISRIVLFGSTRNTPLAADTERYETRFSAKKLDALYIKALFAAPGKPLKLKYYLKVENISTKTLFCESSGIVDIGSQATSNWISTYAKSGTWKTGQYRYTWNLGKSQNQGLFTVY